MEFRCQEELEEELKISLLVITNLTMRGALMYVMNAIMHVDDGRFESHDAMDILWEAQVRVEEDLEGVKKELKEV